MNIRSIGEYVASRKSETVTIAIALCVVLFAIGVAVVGSRSNTLSYRSGTHGSVDSIESKPQPPKETFTVVTEESTVLDPEEAKSRTLASDNVPTPVQFASFAYDSEVGKLISVSGTCMDSYYALVIFDSNVDYRARPDAAVFNQAFPCPPEGVFKLETDLRSYNLKSGGYYFFIADQGSGAWYNPR